MPIFQGEGLVWDYPRLEAEDLTKVLLQPVHLVLDSLVRRLRSQTSEVF